MKKRIISFAICLLVLVGISGLVVVDVNASDITHKQICVDGSYLTTNESSSGESGNSLLRGKHMMDGECSITKAGLSRVYCYGATTANHDVDYIAVLVYVEKYDEDESGGFWGHYTSWVADDENTYFVSTGKTIKVDRGYYYRVRADHFVEKKPDPMEDTFSYTDGILVPAP